MLKGAAAQGLTDMRLLTQASVLKRVRKVVALNAVSSPLQRLKVEEIVISAKSHRFCMVDFPTGFNFSISEMRFIYKRSESVFSPEFR
jgi:hypothetical protein